MSKKLTRRDFLKTAGFTAASVAVGGLLSGCSNESSVSKNGIYTPGTYSATAKGMGTVKATLTFDSDKITDVVLDLSAETPSIGQAAAEELIAQILDKQSHEIDAVASATVTSNAVSKAVKNCIAQAKGEVPVTVIDQNSPTKVVTDWLGEEPETPEIDQTVETDTVIVGAGNGGLMCGAYAAKLNLKFVMIETLPTNGDTRHWYGAIGSKHAQAAGVKMDINRLKREVSRYASGKNSKVVLNTWINESAQMADFIDDLYAEYNPESVCTFTAGEEAYWPEDCRDGYMFPEQEHVWGREKSRNDMLAEYIHDHSDAEIYYNTDLVKIERDEAGKICGIIAQNNQTDETMRIKASHVVIATGGYPGNPDMMEQLDPLGTSVTTACSYAPQDTGMGIKAACWVGAKLQEEPAPMLFDRGLVAPGVDAGLITTSTGDRVFPGTVRQFNLGTQPFLKVNRNGLRFTNESGPYNDMSYAAAGQPGHVYASILAGDWADQVDRFHTIGCSAQTRANPQGQQKALEGYIENGLAFKADTIEELGVKLGFENEALSNFVATCQRYDELAAKGNDEDFGKPASRLSRLNVAPYYGFWLGASLLTTEQGIMINGKGQALDENNQVIEGLYVIGDASGGMFFNNYPCLMPGIACGRTLTYGMKVAKVIAGIEE